jgi:uncharacterized membrane protein YfcA
VINLVLFLAGIASWTISTFAAGGGSILLVAAITTILRGHAIAPVVTCASAIASPARIILFRGHIDWIVVRWYLPGAIVGAVVGGWTFAHVSGRLIQLCIGTFLIGSLWQFRVGNRPQWFRMSLPWFVPVSFVSGLTSAVVGASGLLSNPFYLNYGLTKERMLATRAVNSIAIQLVKIAAYLAFGVLNWDLLGHGVAAGAGGAVAIWFTRPWLRRLDPGHFRKFAVSMMVLAGLLAVWQQRTWIVGLLTGR